MGERPRLGWKTERQAAIIPKTRQLRTSGLRFVLNNQGEAIMCFGGNKAGKAAAEEAKRARADEDKRQAEIRDGRKSIDKTFKQFDGSFFDKNKQAFMDYASPQLDRQFGDASKELSFDLARSGLTNSSTRGTQTSKLQEAYDRNLQQVTNEALSREQQQRNAVEGSRADLISLLQTTGDAKGATNQALSRAAMLSQPQPFSPIGQLFTDFTAGLGTQAALERAASVSGGRYQPRYNTGLFGAPRGAVQNRR
jgi:hypothetical protein